MFPTQGQNIIAQKSIHSTKYNKQYNLLELIYQGKEELVYKGEEITNQGKEIVAIKVQRSLNQQIIETFMQKKFTNLINIRDIINQQQNSYIVMDYGDENFYSYMQSQEYKQKSLNEKRDLFIQIVKGVEELHEMKMIHRDLKPENILYIKQQNNGILLKICDFGQIKYPFNLLYNLFIPLNGTSTKLCKQQIRILPSQMLIDYQFLIRKYIQNLEYQNNSKPLIQIWIIQPLTQSFNRRNPYHSHICKTK